MGGAQRPVTFLTHFRIPFLPLLFLLLPGRPRGRRRSEEPPASSPSAAAGGVHPSPARWGTLQESAPPPPRLPLRGSSLVTWTTEHLLATSAPQPSPSRRSPSPAPGEALAGGQGHPMGSGSGHPALRDGTGAAGDACTAAQFCKVHKRLGQAVTG